MIDLHALLVNYFEHRLIRTEPTAAVHRCARRREPGRDVLRNTGGSHNRFFFVHVCVNRHSRYSADQQFRAQGSAHRTYDYCCTFSIVHVET